MPITIHIDGVISEHYYSGSLAGIREQIGSSTDTINIHINSPGGVLTEGLAIYDYLKSIPNRKNVFVEGIAYSIASVIMLVAPRERRMIMPNAEILIHEVRLSSLYDEELLVDDLERYAEMLREYNRRVSEIYVNETNLDIDEVQALMKKETVLNAEQAETLGFVGDVLSPVPLAYVNNSFKNKINNNKMSKAQQVMTAFSRFLGLYEEVDNVINSDQAEKLDVTESEDSTDVETEKTSEVVEDQQDTILTVDDLSEKIDNLEARIAELVEENREKDQALEKVEALNQKLEKFLARAGAKNEYDKPKGSGEKKSPEQEKNEVLEKMLNRHKSKA